MIVISGCSWACGEWDRGDLGLSNTHKGLSRYVEDAGLTQINLGIPSGSNLAVAHRVNSWLQRHATDQKVEKIFVFQTDYARDFGRVFAEDYDQIDHADSLAHIMISRFYHRLEEISNNYSVPVYLIGGVSDTLSPELVKSLHPGLEVACQSMTNLMINDFPNIDIPVLSWYTVKQLSLVDKIKKLLPLESMPEFMSRIDQGIDRESQVFSCTEFFWPDGCHPNRQAYKKLFDFLKTNNYL